MKRTTTLFHLAVLTLMAGAPIAATAATSSACEPGFSITSEPLPGALHWQITVTNQGNGVCTGNFAVPSNAVRGATGIATLSSQGFPAEASLEDFVGSDCATRPSDQFPDRVEVVCSLDGLGAGAAKSLDAWTGASGGMPHRYCLDVASKTQTSDGDGGIRMTRQCADVYHNDPKGTIVFEKTDPISVPSIEGQVEVTIYGGNYSGKAGPVSFSFTADELAGASGFQVTNYSSFPWGVSLPGTNGTVSCQMPELKAISCSAQNLTTGIAPDIFVFLRPLTTPL